MTALNLALAADRAMVIVDSLMIGEAKPIYTSKCLALPHLQLVAAAMGQHRLFVGWLLCALSGTPAGSNIRDFTDVSQATLSAAWARIKEPSPTRLLMVGTTPDDRLLAISFDSPTFEPHELTPGCYLCPPLKFEAQEEPLTVGSVTLKQRPAGAPNPAPSWRQDCHLALASLELQRAQAERPNVGGWVEACEISRDSIRQFRLRDLDAVPDDGF